MLRFSALIILAVFVWGPALGQRSQLSSGSVDLGMGVATDQLNFSGAYVYNWSLGTKRKFEAGVGGRLTTSFGTNQYFTTAPAKLTTGGSPFGEPIKANIDSLLIASVQIFSINAMLNFGYHITKDLTVGFNIDAIGFSFGGRNKGTYVNGTTVESVISNPTPFNLLLLGDNDRGTLNSEFYARYRLNDRWSVKAGLQHLFTEYTTETQVQQFPEPNNRFRNKSNLFTVGVSMTL